MFSIIIPLYNKADYIAETLKSVLNQTYCDYEVIVVNDSSTDNSLEVASSFQDERIHIYTKENEGVSAARNYGIMHAKYDYIAFLDADDIWESDYLAYIIHSGFISGYQNRYGDNLKPPTNVYHRMTA